MKVNAVVFDWSGTISDDRRPVYEANMRMFNHYGKPRITFEQWQERSTLTATEIMRDHGIEADPKELSLMYTEFYGDEVNNGNLPVVYPDARTALESLRGRKKIALISSHPEEHLIDEAQSYALSEFFPLVVGGVSDKAVCLELTASELRENPADVVYVGDTVFDVRAAKKANTRSAAKLGGYHSEARLRAEEPDIVVASLQELAEMVE